MKGEFRKVDDKTLVAVGTEAMEALANVHRGANCMADVRGARNVEQFNMFWALCELVAKARDVTKIAVKEWLLEKCGLVEMIWMPDGKIKIRPKSIAFESMAQAEFGQFFSTAINHMATLLDSNRKDLIAQFNDMLDPDARRHFKKLMRYKPSPPTQPDEGGGMREMETVT
jgi:hypothetical protein